MTNAELQSDLDACHVKEGDRLDFVEKLTAKTMLLQSDHCLLEVKVSKKIFYIYLMVKFLLFIYFFNFIKMFWNIFRLPKKKSEDFKFL